MNKQKGLAPILIVLLIALGIGGYLIYQKQVTPVTIPQQITQSIPTSVPVSAEGIKFTVQVKSTGNKDMELTQDNVGKVVDVSLGATISLRGWYEKCKIEPSKGILETPPGTYNLPMNVVLMTKAVGIGTATISCINSQTNETANWKTYTNTKYGFTVNYPSDWKVGELTMPVSLNKSGDSAPIVNFHAPGFPTPGVGLDGGIGFFVHMTESSIVLADWVKDNGYKSPDASYETIKMAGYNAVRINFVMTQDRRNEILSLPGGRGGPLPVGYKAIFTYIQKGDLIFEIQAGKITNPDDFLKIADQLLSTFKFTQ